MSAKANARAEKRRSGCGALRIHAARDEDKYSDDGAVGRDDIADTKDDTADAEDEEEFKAAADASDKDEDAAAMGASVNKPSVAASSAHPTAIGITIRSIVQIKMAFEYMPAMRSMARMTRTYSGAAKP